MKHSSLSLVASMSCRRLFVPNCSQTATRKYAVTAYQPSLGKIAALTSPSKVVVIDFSAEWCGPCKAVAPQFAQLSESHADVSFFKVDVDECSEVATEFNIRAVPTFIVFKGGVVVERVEGAAVSTVVSAIEKAKKQ